MIPKRPKNISFLLVCTVLLMVAGSLTACKRSVPRDIETDVSPNAVTDAPIETSASPDISSMPALPPEETKAPVDDPLTSPGIPSDDLLAQGYSIDYSDDNSTVYFRMPEGYGLMQYFYRIGTEEPYLAEGIYEGSLCRIDYINGILRLRTGSGTSGEVQYFDLENRRKSDSFPTETGIAEYIRPTENHCLIAYITFDTSKESAPAYLAIEDLFNYETIAIIERSFRLHSRPLNELSFVSENEIYIDYDIWDIDEAYKAGDITKQEYSDRLHNGDFTWTNVTETVAFR